jgi:hypothetical protein
MKLGKSEFRAFSSLCSNYSAVFLASLVIPAFLPEVDMARFLMISLGVIGALTFWILSAVFAKRGKL